MTEADPFVRLAEAAGRPGQSSSDFDLNPDGPPAPAKLRPAGVLVGFVDLPGGAELILTKRSSALKHHPGQIAFPGGKVDARDADVIAAAIREAKEEVGLDPAHVDIIGTLPSHRTVTGFDVTPVLARIRSDFTPVAEPGEVDEVFRVPFAHIANPDHFSVQSRRWQGRRRYFYTVPYGPYYIWGATARILRALADRLM